MAEEKERLGQQAARCRWGALLPVTPGLPSCSHTDLLFPDLPACRQRAELEELRQQLEESSAALTRTLRADFERSREEQEQRHQVGVPSPSGCEEGSLMPDPQQGGRGLGVALRLLTACPLQMELKALKDQLEAERQAWVANCAKKEVGQPDGLLRALGCWLPGVTPAAWGRGGPSQLCRAALSACGSRKVRIRPGGNGAGQILEI